MYKKWLRELKRRHGRTNGIGHDGDCGIYNMLGICTCGLIHFLILHYFECDDKELKEGKEGEYIKETFDGNSQNECFLDYLVQENMNRRLYVECRSCEGKRGKKGKCKECKGKGVVKVLTKESFIEEHKVSDEEMKEMMQELYDQFGGPVDKDGNPISKDDK